MTWLIFAASVASAQCEPSLSWQALEQQASGQSVYFNAWGGDLAINSYVEWAGRELAEKYQIRLIHVKVTDIAEAVSRIMAEQAAGRHSDGSVDLLWINGENFAALKNAGLLWGPWADRLPNAKLVNWQGNPTTRIDATLPTDAFEMPWGTATLTLFFDSDQVHSRPVDPDSLLQWIEQHPGRFTYPEPPAFLGSAFLKQMLYLLTDDPERLQRPVGEDFDEFSKPLWQWLDTAHRSMWRRGRLFPRSGPAQRELLALGEVDWMLSFNPEEASRAILHQQLQPGIGRLYFDQGALANSHFLAIPVNTGACAAAMVTSNFLLSAEAQARKADVQFWGDPTVLDLARLPARTRALFRPTREILVAAPLAKRTLPEPHADWTTRLEAAWLDRYVR